MSIKVPAQRLVPETEAATAAPAPVAESGWGRVLRVSVARASLALVFSLVIWSLLPLLAGWTPRVILSGSMEPRVHVGDIVVTRPVPAENLAKGQVITVTDPDHPEKTRTHRVLRREADGMLVLKGDANQSADSTPVSTDDVLGLGVVRVPYVGRPAYWIAERNWLALGATSLFLGWCLVTVLPSSRRSQDTPGDDTDPPAPPSTTPRNPRPRRIAASVAVAAMTVGAAAGPADAAFRLAVGNPVSTLRSATHFYDYKTEVVGDTPYFYWRLDETTGTAIADSSGGTSRPGSLLAQTYAMNQTGALTSESLNRAIGFTVASVTTNSSYAGLGTFSVEAW
ncbi:MAG: signal peptidase I, partial [Marmoricola sp.]